MSDAAYNFNRLEYHPEAIKALANGSINPPIQVRIKPINRCNHDCFFCAYSDTSRKEHKNVDAIDHIDTKMHQETNLKDMIPTDRLISLIGELADYGVKSITLSGGGEPTIHPGFLDAIKIAHKRGLDTSLITNGSVIKNGWMDEMMAMKWIRISIDYSSPDSLARSRNIHHGEFDKIMANISKLCSYKRITGSKVEIGVNFIVHKDNKSSIAEMANTLANVGVDNIRFSPIWIPDFRRYHEEIEDDVLDQLKEIGGKVKNTSIFSTYDINAKEHYETRPYKICYTQHLVPVIGADQYIYRCHHLAFTEEGRLADISHKTFSEAWEDIYNNQLHTSFDCKANCKHQCVYDNRNIEIQSKIEKYPRIDDAPVYGHPFRNFL